MSVINVSNTVQLVAAVKAANSGDVVQLASGTYSHISLTGLAFKGGITITSANPGNPAVLTGMTLKGVAGITVTNVEMVGTKASTLPDFLVRESSNVHFDSVVIKGVPSDGPHVSQPFMFRNSENVSLTNSEVTQARYGVALLGNTGVEITGNYFHDLRTDGVRGGGNSEISISGNLFTNFRAEAGDHGDAIQFWTTNETESATNITIADNLILRGEGTPVQGIFMRDETTKLPYQNVTIDGNLILGGMYHGISAPSVEGLVVTDNTVMGYEDQKSWIRVNNATILAGNTAETFILDGVNVSNSVGNTLHEAVRDMGLAAVDSWLSQNAVFASHFAEVSNGASSVLTAAALLPNAPDVPLVAPTKTINGTYGADTLKNKTGNAILIGGGGNDHFTGGTGNTQMEGGVGDDTYVVQSTRDVVIETADGGKDTVYSAIDFRLGDHIEVLRLTEAGLTGWGNALDNRIVGTDGVDKMFGEGGVDALQGLGGDDVLNGGEGQDTLSGGDGNDTLFGGAGIDKLLGDEGADWIYGGDGADVIEGGAGADILFGGAGKDSFSYRPGDLAGRDVIRDFSLFEGDNINLSAIDANVLTAKNEAFKFIGNAAFSGKAGELHFLQTKDGALIEGDVNGDGIADLSVLLTGITSVTSAFFTL